MNVLFCILVCYYLTIYVFFSFLGFLSHFPFWCLTYVHGTLYSICCPVTNVVRSCCCCRFSCSEDIKPYRQQKSNLKKISNSLCVFVFVFTLNPINAFEYFVFLLQQIMLFSYFSKKKIYTLTLTLY